MGWLPLILLTFKTLIFYHGPTVPLISCFCLSQGLRWSQGLAVMAFVFLLFLITHCTALWLSFVVLKCALWTNLDLDLSSLCRQFNLGLWRSEGFATFEVNVFKSNSLFFFFFFNNSVFVLSTVCLDKRGYFNTPMEKNLLNLTQTKENSNQPVAKTSSQLQKGLPPPSCRSSRGLQWCEGACCSGQPEPGTLPHPLSHTYLFPIEHMRHRKI